MNFIIFIISTIVIFFNSFLVSNIPINTHIDIQKKSVIIETNMPNKIENIKTVLEEVSEKVLLENILEKETSIKLIKEKAINTEFATVKRELDELNKCVLLSQEDKNLLFDIQKKYEKGNYQTCLMMIITAPPSLLKCKKN